MNKKLIVAAIAVVALALPVLASNGVESGLNVGENVPPFNPTHLSGPDKGTTKCPP